MTESAGEHSSGHNGAASNGAAANGAAPEDHDEHPARQLTLHLLRMFETRMDAAGIAIDSEMQSFASRVQLKLLAAGLAFLAIWCGIVLLAVALPESARIPVLAGVIALFVAGAVWAQMAAKRRESPRDIGSMRWFLDGLKLDVDVLARSLAHKVPPPAAEHQGSPNDFAA